MRGVTECITSCAPDLAPDHTVWVGSSQYFGGLTPTIPIPHSIYSCRRRSLTSLLFIVIIIYLMMMSVFWFCLFGYFKMWPVKCGKRSEGETTTDKPHPSHLPASRPTIT